jgi:hypothetical protein
VKLMPARSKIAKLPPTVRTELERRIVERAFGGYRELAEWLPAQGYHIAEDSIQRHGARLQQEMKEMERLSHEALEPSARTQQHAGSRSSPLKKNDL